MSRHAGPDVDAEPGGSENRVRREGHDLVGVAAVQFLTGSVFLGKKCLPAGRRQDMTVHHLPSRTACQDVQGPVDVVSWRRCRLLEAGFPPDLAGRLAADLQADVHALLALVDRGCPPGLAARILSPLPPGGPA